MPGDDGVSVADFAARVDRELSTLAEELAHGTYRSGVLHHIRIPKRAGGHRDLGIPTVRDRVAQRAVLTSLHDVLDVGLAEACFAYRKGHSWLDALRAVQRGREAGFAWVLRADIAAFFDRIDHGVLERQLLEHLDPASVDLVLGWVTAPVRRAGRLVARPRGVPQGSVIAPSLANFYLAGFDRALNGAFGPLVRYADDCTALCRSQKDARRTLDLADALLRDLRLDFNVDKSRITSFADGFTFLGWRFEGSSGREVAPTEGWTHPFASSSEN